VRRPLALAATATLLAAPVTAQAQTGGAEYRPRPRLAATTFELTPAIIAPAATLTARFRIDGTTKRVRIRIDLLPDSGGTATRVRLGRRRTGRTITHTFRPDLAPGRYTARLRATAARRHRKARVSGVSTIEVTAPAVSAATGIFPVQGAYTLGDDAARFGAPRRGHSHRGQDIIAAEGTPVVSPRAGFVTWRAYQAEGAGHYLVVRADDARDYVFMHLQDGSIAVEKGQGVAAGEQLAAVGATGRADGAHLHFEIWPDGWFADGSEPIDPLPDLLAWAAVAG
jgi:murein DD-endopeptidase MepM/ murein hydrolase activator NlpD